MKHLIVFIFVFIFLSCQKEPTEPSCTETKTCWYSQVESVECDLDGDGIFDYTQYVIDTTFSSINECDVNEWLLQTQEAINNGNPYNVNHPSKCGCF